MDISADLIELGRCPVTVVSAGIKSILDIGRSLEVLETQGVAVATLGSSAAFPAFYSPTSGFNSPLRFDTVQDCARAMQAARALRLESGMLLAVPIPEPHASRAAPLQAAVEQAIAESEASGIASSGKEVTPWLLGRVNELTQGRSVESNVALIENNVTVAAQLARTYSALLDPPAPSQPPISERPKEISDANKVRGTIAVIGCMALDITSVMPASALVKTTYAGTVKFSLGGVARNVAEAAHKLLPGANVALVAPVNANFASRYAIEAIEQLGMRRDALLPLQTSRGVGVANLLLDSQGLLQAGVVDMTSVEQVTAEEIKSKLNDVIDMSKRSIAIFDANLRPEVIASVLAYCHERGVATLFEPTSLDKASRICHTFQTQRQPRLSMMTPNAIELRRMYDTCRKVQLDQEDRWFASIDLLGIDSDFRAKLDRRMPRWMLDQGIPQQAIFMLAFVDTLLVKCGSQGFLVAHRLNGPQGAKEDKHSVINEHLMMQYFPAVPAEIVNDTGAGDSMAGAWAAAYVQNGFASADAVRKAALYAQRAAIASLQSEVAGLRLSLMRFYDIGSNLSDPVFRGIVRGKRAHQDDLSHVMSRAAAAGVRGQMLTGDSLEGSREAVDLVKKLSKSSDMQLSATVGCHPCRATEPYKHARGPDGYFDDLRALIEADIAARKQGQPRRVAAVGECGLDYDRLEHAERAAQLDMFPRHFALAREFKLPLFLHSRTSEAHVDFVRILNQSGDAHQLPGVVHSFTGTVAEAKELIDLGLYIGVNGCSLKTAENLEVVKSLPLDKLLLETDAPWCSITSTSVATPLLDDFPAGMAPIWRPSSVKKERWAADKMVKGRNEPCTIGQVAHVVAKLHSVPLDVLAEQVWRNTQALLHPSESV
ncbi:uncharacterized protein L969DRAFT_17377 [Mixia osmundae IAM 14324]|uniref:uncharacterized protein n=1 Tax=Mixia osmundae (strain CBS 9802 / IAM 14324 / JCM 22182 / KY 12970) TaxID=764103 RepID=UPI0004A54F31|nr:uncharacterized protein L969DRAFT_17377 [Mixia osmundae IAM 14324]KEI39455.1 hypothetical protein L969DRAFT_17377 [Mixia osmundae IAM 14324]